jgi:hypothetical protein
MKIFKLLLSIMGLLSFISCGSGGGNTAQQKDWQKAKPISGPAKLDHPKALATDDKFIYFVTGSTVAGQHEGTNNVMKMALNNGEGGEPTVLFKGGESIPADSSIALDDTYVYFNADGFRRIPKSGGEAALLSKAADMWEFVLDGENIYWLPFVGEGSSPKPVYSIPKSGGEPKVLSEPVIASGLSFDDKFLYWTSPDGIYHMPKTGGAIEKIYATANKEVVSDLRMDAENFYFLEVTRGNLIRVPRTGGDAVIVAKDASKFWLSEKDVIFSRYVGVTDTGLFKVAKTGGSETELDRNGYVADLVVGKNKIYLSDIVKIFEL